MGAETVIAVLLAVIFVIVLILVAMKYCCGGGLYGDISGGSAGSLNRITPTGIFGS
ncbi:Hypothetical protein POVN_LOCUS720 [uncultured virus]|nr:Hypothetical protein POVN_LOCUS720 [uncultured virus]